MELGCLCPLLALIIAGLMYVFNDPVFWTIPILPAIFVIVMLILFVVLLVALLYHLQGTIESRNA